MPQAIFWLLLNLLRPCTFQAAEASAIKENCEAILAEAMPILNAAIKALDTIKPADIKLVESFKSPPGTVKLVMEAVCVMLGEKPISKQDPDNPGKKIMDYWETSRKVLKVTKLAFCFAGMSWSRNCWPNDIMSKMHQCV